MKVFAERAHVLQQFPFSAQELDGNGAGQRASAERGPVQTRAHATRHPLGGEDGTEWQTTRQRLGDGDHIRLHTVVLVGKVAPGSAEAALNLVEHQQRAAAFGQARSKFENLWIDRANPALSLNGFQAHGADAGIEFSLQVVQVIEVDEAHTRQERHKRSPIFRLTRGSERAKRPSMKRVFHGEDARLWAWLAAVLIIHLREGARELERSLPGLGAAVAKESAIKPGDFGHPPREFRLILVEKQIGNMNQSACLTLDRRLDGRMVVAQRIDSDPTQEVQIPLAARIPEIHATPANKKNGLALVGGKQELRFHAGDRSEAHALSTSVPHSSLVK